MEQTIRETTLRELVAAAAVQSACAVGQKGGYTITVVCKHEKLTLAATRGGIRLFTLENAAKFLSGIGIPEFEVNARTYEPGRLRKPRPDRSEALKRTRTTLKQASLL